LTKISIFKCLQFVNANATAFPLIFRWTRQLLYNAVTEMRWYAKKRLQSSYENPPNTESVSRHAKAHNNATITC